MEFSTELTFIAQNTTANERTAFLATVTAVNVAGFIMGPALGTLLSFLDIVILGYAVDQYNGPGWLLATMFIVDLILVRGLFEDGEEEENNIEYQTQISEKIRLLNNGEKEAHDISYGATSTDLNRLEGAINSAGEEEAPPSLTLVLSLIVIQFILMSGWSVLETITSPLAQEHFNWDVLECNLLFTAGGAVSLVAYLVVVIASKWVQDRWLIGNALALCFVGFLMAIDWQQLGRIPSWTVDILPSYRNRFIAGYFVMNAGFMTGRPITFALYSKLIAPKYQGTYLGWMVAGGSAARTLGPFVAVKLFFGFEKPGFNLLALFGPTAMLHLVCIVLVWLEWLNLLPQQEEPDSAKKRDSTASTDLEDFCFSSDDDSHDGVGHHFV
ncbi:MAG: hypothetical protein SGILL_006960 [Bacillariaceae sp.]